MALLRRRIVAFGTRVRHEYLLLSGTWHEQTISRASGVKLFLCCYGNSNRYPQNILCECPLVAAAGAPIPYQTLAAASLRGLSSQRCIKTNKDAAGHAIGQLGSLCSPPAGGDVLHPLKGSTPHKPSHPYLYCAACVLPIPSLPHPPPSSGPGEPFCGCLRENDSISSLHRTKKCRKGPRLSAPPRNEKHPRLPALLAEAHLRAGGCVPQVRPLQELPRPRCTFAACAADSDFSPRQAKLDP